LEQVRFPKPLPLVTLMAYSDAGDIRDLTELVEPDGALSWTAPAGTWTLYAVFEGWHGKMVERAGPGGEGNVIDHFSQDALDHYLARFDRAFAGHDLHTLRAFFNDSYEVDDASGEAGWTDHLFDQFRRRRGYDLREHLPDLLAADTDDTNGRVLCDYRETISDLLLDEFTRPWNRWARRHGAIIRNQAHGSPGNLLDLYAASDIPETEGSNRLGFKLASSAAHVTGKRLASAEAATWLDEHFCATLGDVKAALDRYFLGGINHVCYHGTTYSPPQEDWPGWMFYASVHFGPTNPFWNDFSALNDYAARCQSFLQAGEPDNDVAVYWPIHDLWSRHGRGLLLHVAADVPGAAKDAGQGLLRDGYTFDFISDRQLLDARFADQAVQTAGGRYRAVLLPECRYIPLPTLAKLVELAGDGAVILVQNQMPSEAAGWADLEQRQKALRELTGRISFAPSAGSDIQAASVGEGRFLLADAPGTLLSQTPIKPEPLVGAGLEFVRRRHEHGKEYFLANAGKDSLDGWVSLRDGARSAVIFEPLGHNKGLAALRLGANGGIDVYLQLAAGQTCIVKTFDTALAGPLYPYRKSAGPAVAIGGGWSVQFVEGGPQLPPAVEIEQLVSWTDFNGNDPAYKNFSGAARYAISFARPAVSAGSADGWRLDLGQVHESARVRINQQELATLITSPFQVLIPADLLREDNLLEVTVSNSMANRIADLDRRSVAWKKFYNVNFPARSRDNRGPDGLFSAAQWPPRSSGLLGPVTLEPVTLPDEDALSASQRAAAR
ncbi:MAG: hypothetical protein JW810_03635, partial [Sedimentisphaerales bacterium]|nr:hypothetical protein [Sedimentisphaerales bacterium]